MMKPLFYIQITRSPSRLDFEDSKSNLIYSVQELDCDVHVEQYKFFESSEMDFSFLPTDRPVIFIGGIQAALEFQKRKLDIKPFCWFDEKLLACQTYYGKWGKYLLQRFYGFYPLSEIRRMKNWIWETYSLDGKVFIRPDSNDKAFTAEVVKYDLFNDHDESKDLLCVVSRPERIWTEWRFIMSKGVVVAGSQYRDGSAVILSEHYPQEAADFAEKVATEWSPHPIFCLDIAETPDGYKVIECGSVNCDGYYKADTRKIVEAMIDNI